MKILIIEDEQVLAESIKSYLKANDVLCEIAHTIGQNWRLRIRLHFA
jgi:DNA-binding response OmpR family regulator